MSQTKKEYPYDIAYYMNQKVAVPTGSTISFTEPANGQSMVLDAGFVLFGNGVKSFDESPNTIVSESAYIINKSVTKTTDGFDFSFSGTADILRGDPALEAITNVHKHSWTGPDAERLFLVVDTLDVKEVEIDTILTQVYFARLFKLAIATQSISSSGNDPREISFDLNAANDPLTGYYDQTTKTFYVEIIKPE